MIAIWGSFHATLNNARIQFTEVLKLMFVPNNIKETKIFML